MNKQTCQLKIALEDAIKEIENLRARMKDGYNWTHVDSGYDNAGILAVQLRKILKDTEPICELNKVDKKYWGKKPKSTKHNKFSYKDKP
jgi:hypothetical protein